ncbi:MAG: hypothetical protein Q8942_12720 [Bacillota bacterium]|nr:hypothetical protein [Bacillota bacterium]
MKKLFLLILLMLCVSNKAYANSGPWRSEPAPGFNALPLKSNSVEVVKEDLTFDMTADKTPYKANVSANYTLRNWSEKSDTYSIAFPYVGGYLNDWDKQDKYFNAKVSFDGKLIIPKIKLLPKVLFNASDGLGGKGVYIKDSMVNLTFEDILRHMKSAIDSEDFDITKYIDRDPVTGELINTANRTELVVLMLFDITMPADSTCELKVSYNQIGGEDRYKTRDYTCIYNYFLEPAKYWKSFKDLNITVKTPEGYKIIESNLNLNEVKDAKGTYAGHFVTLPEKNLEFQVYKSLNTAQKIYEAIDMKFNLRWTMPIMMVLGTPILIVALVAVVYLKRSRNIKKT